MGMVQSQLMRLHQFASRKVQEAAPAMTPKIIVFKDEGFRIRIAKVPLGDIKVKYRREVEMLVQEDEGEIDPIINRSYLDELRASLGLRILEAEAIEHQVLEPFRQRQAKMARYRDVFHKAMKRRNPLSDKDQRGLRRLQHVLSLRDDDVEAMESLIIKEYNGLDVRQNQEPSNSEVDAESLDRSHLDEVWQQVLQKVEPLGIQALLSQQSCLLFFDGKEAQIGLRSGKFLTIAQGRSANVRRAFLETLGQDVSISFVEDPNYLSHP